MRRLVMVLSSVAVLVASLVVSSPVEAAVIRPFTPRFSLNAAGAITITGNTLLTCPPSATQCLQARTGTASSANANNDNNYNMIFVDIDGDPATFNSSRNTLDIPRTSAVAWAGLYWGADTSAGTGGSAAASPTARGSVLLQTPDAAGYTSIVATQVDASPTATGPRYQGFADVTGLVQSARSGEYTVANLQAGRGADRYGGWALVVVYQDPNEPVRNLTVFDGYGLVEAGANNNVSFPVSGFRTPPTGPVRTRLGVVAYEGDLGLVGDSLRLNSTILTNSLNPSNNFFNSSLTGFESTNRTGDPFQANMLGFDIDTIRATDVLANGATSATINMTTNNDTYFPGAVSFSTELFAPRLDLDKTGVDVNGGTLDVGDQVLYSVRVTNNGQDAASEVEVSDAIPAGSTFVPGSILVDGARVSDASGDDTGELSGGAVVARLGTGASSAAGGAIAVGATRTLSFRVTVGLVDPDDALVNTATATYLGATSGLPVEAISNRVVLSPRSRSDLTVLKFGPSAPVTVPGAADFRVVVTNRGPSTEPAATMTDELPAGYVVSGVATSQGSCATGAVVDCALGRLGVGASATIDISGSFTTGTGVATNTASVGGANLDLFSNNDVANAVVDLNGPPTAVDQAASTPGGSPVIVSVQDGASDPDGDPLITTAAGPAANGTVIVNPDGTVTYTPAPGFKGTDTFPFTIGDGQGGTATAVVTVTVLNAPPVAVDDAVATLAGAGVTIPVLDNDSDPNPTDTIVIGSFTQPAGGPATGVVSDNGDGTLRFAPAAGFRGDATFTYTIEDDDGAASTATVTVSVPDGAPVAVDDAIATDSDTTVTIPVLDNDLDDNGQTLTVISITQPDDPSVGSVSLVAGVVGFDPAAGFKGDVTFTYTIRDTALLTSTADVVVTVRNAPPIATDNSADTDAGTTVSIDVLSDDSDANADPLTIIGVGSPTGGAISVDGGVVTYTPDPGFKGLDSFPYTVSDGTDTSTATISVRVANGPPVGAADRRQTESGTSVTIPVLANDTDPNGDVLTLSPGGISNPPNGSVVESPDGTLTYTPDPGFVGIDTFTYTLTDGEDTSIATVTIIVIDRGPTAVDDAETTAPATAVAVDVLSNDTDPEDDVLSVIFVGAPGDGTAEIDDQGGVTYTPDPGFEGVDTFDYTITDGTIPSTATVTITVSATVVPTTVVPTTVASTVPTTVAPTTTGPVTNPGVPGVPGPTSPTTTFPRIDPSIPATGRSSTTTGMWALMVFAVGVALTLVARRRGPARS
ncbi:MAG: Ig-like domain-containing protein [Ilumatobacter sp.]|uniref:Ig-like domain-containing protein n=1 Tax=Ilumatobacter sp. TaxID=1967498 RepID=UPI003C747BBC